MAPMVLKVTESEDEFATLFAASVQAKRFERGQTIEGRVVAIGPEVAFVDVGGKGEAEVDVAELKDADGDIEVDVGDRIQMLVVGVDGGLKLSRRLARGAATNQQLESAYEAGLPVEGKVERVVKGGLEVRIGHSRAFCPISQIDNVRTTEPEVHLGRVYAFRVIEYKEGGKNVIVSRRVLLDEEQRVQAADIRKSVVAGAVLKGRVASVRDFGAFVDLGAGVQGLLHVSEIGWSRVADAAQALQPGQEITVKVLRVEEDSQRIALGLKQLTDDPWLQVGQAYEVGQIRPGRVTRVTDFGAFIELEPGVEALAHASTFAPMGGGARWSRLVPVGSTATFEVLSIDLEKKRMGVALVQDAAPRAAPLSSRPSRPELTPGARATGKIERHEKFGLFVFLSPGRTGLMPLSETGVDKESDLAKAFPVGSDIEVVILEADPAGRRIRVSRKAVLDAQDAAELREYAERSEAPPSGGLGSLADKLRGALGSRQK